MRSQEVSVEQTRKLVENALKKEMLLFDFGSGFVRLLCSGESSDVFTILLEGGGGAGGI